MSVSGDQLDSFAALGTALGLLRGGQLNGAWFENPMGSVASADQRGLATVIFDDEQRAGLLSFVDDVLGPPGRTTADDAIWVPLFANPSPAVTIYAVVRELAGVVHLGIAVEHSTGTDAPSLATRLHIPVFQLDRSGAPNPAAGGGLPDWLLLGREGGLIELTADVAISTAQPVPGEAYLGGVAISLGIPTSSADDLRLGLTLRDLQLPGTSTPRTFELDAANVHELGSEVFELVTGLIRAQADALDLTDPALRPLAALTGILGLRDVSGLPPLPLAAIPTAGVAALVGWIEGLLNDNAARDAWLGQVALLVGGALDAAHDAVTIDVGPVHLSIGVRVTPGTGGHPVLVPWASLRYDIQAGAVASLAVDLLRADTATGQVSALPSLRAEAVFGSDAGGGPLLDGPDPTVGSLHVGVGLTDLRTPAIVVTLTDCVVATRPYPVLDLSTPQAALDAANDVIDGALVAALGALGEAGTLVANLIGLDPPVGVIGSDATALLADPLGALAGYWSRLSADPSAAEVFGKLRRLVTGVAEAAVPGDGTVAAPWIIDIVGTAGLHVSRVGDVLRVDLACVVDTPTLGEFTATVLLRVNVLTVDLTARSVAFVSAASGAISLHRTDGGLARLDLSRLAIEAGSIGAEMRWTPTAGFGVQFAADDLAVEIAPPPGPATVSGPIRIDLPLPHLDASGRLVFAPDWDDVERALAGLLREVSSPVIDALVDLAGWDKLGARLSLSAMLSDPRSALESWLADLIFDCDHVRSVLGPVAALISGFRVSEPLGTGSARSPYRCAIAAEPRAPGIAVWLDPGCPPAPPSIGLALDRIVAGGVPPEPGDIHHLVRMAAAALPDLADLLVARDGLTSGLQTVLDRWADTDGLVATPASLPDDVTGLTLDGYAYDDFAALAAVGALTGELFVNPPGAVVHVTCDDWPAAQWPGAIGLDASGATPPAPLAATGDGVWLVRLPSVSVAAASRPDRGGVGEQAARLAAILAGRTAPVTLVGYGEAGAAVIRTSVAVAAVDQVATVATPWGALSVESLRAGLGGDALRFLQRIRLSNPTEWPQPLLAVEVTPLERIRRIVTRSLAAAANTNANAGIPSALSEARRSGVAYLAAFGAVSVDDLAFGVAALVAEGVEARYRAALDGGAGVGAEVVHTALHAGVDVPIVDLDLAGLLVGAGATLEMLTLDRAVGGGLEIRVARHVHVDLRLGVHDGWLIGGPGAATNDLAVRWMSARVSVPLDGGAGTATFVLHEATALGVDRERWEVAADGAGSEATGLVPEVRILLSQVAARLVAASAPLGDALTALGLVTNGGLDPNGLDRLIHDTAATVRSALTTDAVGLAGALRSLTGAVGTGPTVSWSLGGATTTIDLANRSVELGLTIPGTDGVPTIEAAVAYRSATASASVAIGDLDPHAGGLRLVASAASAGAPSIAVEWQPPGAPSPRLIALAPIAESDALLNLATVAIPAATARGVANWLRSTLDVDAGAAFDGVLASLGLLGVPRANGERPLLLPIGLFSDPVGWLRSGATAWRNDPVGTAIALADVLASIIAPARGALPGWPIVPGLSIGYRSNAGRFEITAIVDIDAVIDGRPVSTQLTGGLCLSPSGAPVAVLDAAINVDGRGVRVGIAPHLRVELTRPSPTAPIILYPAAGGIGSVLSSVATMVIPPVLDALRGPRDDAAASFERDVARAVDELLSALDLLESNAVSDARVELFAANPAAWTAARLPSIVASGLAALTHALDPNGTLVAVMPSPPSTTRFAFGPGRSVAITLDAGTTPAIVLSASSDLGGIGHFEVESLRLWAGGLQVSALIGPFPLDLGAAVLRPMVAVRAGVTESGFARMVGVGLAFDDAGDRSVEARWTLDSQPPSLTAVTRTADGETFGSALEAGLNLLSVGTSLATGVALDALGPVISLRATQGLQGVLFTDIAASTDVDPQLFIDLVDPDALLLRLERLAWNLATTAPLSITIDGLVTIGLVADDIGGGRKRLGVNVSLPPLQRFAFPTSGDVKVELEVDASWVDPPEPPGLSIFVLEGSVSAAGEVQLDLQPSVVVAGLGLRFTKTSGPLLDLGGVGIDGIGLSLYGEAATVGVGGGVRLMLEGLAFAPAAGGGDNPVANSIMNDAGAAGPANRPVFSPSIAIQKHPLDPLSVSVRAGQPPGPWWVVVQRQLGPIYLERVGFDTAETAGTVSRITLLFDGSVSLFGLTAAVDQLSLSWLGGDVFDIGSWSVDLMGLAVSADMAGVSLSGGLLKSVDDDVTSYVGMLMGRFGIYGLSVFGGYTDDNGSPSFFVFGGITGPIGGPPAFFLTGIGGGLGINRGLIIPSDLSQFGEYPFIKALDPAASASDDPMGELRKLSEYFPPQPGNFWFAAGISFTSFALVDGVAVVAVSFGEGLEINLLGLARIALPRPQVALVSIELALRARFSTVEGVFMIQAQLTENSWLLYEEVRLTGGFAFAVWWKGPLAGQFVLSIGGYHPDFHRDGYPDVPRLGLVWRVSDAIVIKGGSYFALTSEALMAGVEVEVSADFGWAWAKLSFGAHGIVYFDPFWFEVRAYVRISAGVEIDTWLGTVGFSISLGARLRVWGPDFSGEATIEVGPCEFSVGFGSQRVIAAETLGWSAFVAKYLEDAGDGRARALSSITGRGTLPAATGGDRGAPSSDGSSQRPFEVFAEFELTIVTTVPTSSFDIAGGSPIPVTVKSSSGATAALGISPMRIAALQSVIRVTLHRFDEPTQTWIAQTTRLALLAANLRAAQPRSAGSSFGTDAYPVGAWGLAQPSNLPVKPIPEGDVLFAGNRLQLVAEAQTLTVGPQIDYYQVESGRRPLPLRATGNDRALIRSVANGVSVFAPTDAQGALRDAATVLFAAAPAAALPDGVLARGARSGVERAAFAGQRSAPPLFGTLTDGLALANGADGPAELTVPGVPAAPRGIRPPFVAGYLTAGAGGAIRTPITTVADGGIKRRTAPTVESVQARLGRSLSIQLNRSPVPAGSLRDGTTVLAAAASLIPRTAAVGATASFVGARVGSAVLQGLVAGLDGGSTRGPSRPARNRSRAAAAKVGDPASIVRSGDVVVLHSLDTSVDTNSAGRPRLSIAGRGRVTVLGGTGAVLIDQLLFDGELKVPSGFAIVAVQSDANDPSVADPATGLAGWHSRSRAVQIGSHSAIVPGAVISIDGSIAAAGGLAWIEAGDLVDDAAAVTTRFAGPVRTIAIALSTSGIARLDPLALELGGAELATDDRGRQIEPIVVHSGAVSVLVYSVVADIAPGKPSVRKDTDAVVVRVRAGADWGVVGVLGGSVDAERLATRIARHGLVDVAAKLLSTSGPGAMLTWKPPIKRAPKPRSSGRPTARTTQPRAGSQDQGGRNGR